MPARRASPPTSPRRASPRRRSQARTGSPTAAAGRSSASARSPRSTTRTSAASAWPWYADLNTYRGVEATPLEIDGVLYNISAWDITTAYDAATGKVLWTYDPKIRPYCAPMACCGPVSRGRRRVARQDHHRHARRPADRARRQDRQAGVDRGHVLDKGQPLIDHRRAAHRRRQGGDRQRRRRLRRARLHHRLRTPTPASTPGSSTSCPAIPAKPDGAASDSVMPMAAKTWTGEWWKYGGGGNDWDAHRLRPRAAPGLSSAPATARPTRSSSAAAGGRQPVPLLDRRGRRQDRPLRLALPGNPGRGVGLRLHRADDPGRPEDRRARSAT